MSRGARLALAGNEPPVRERAYLVALLGPEAGRKYVVDGPVVTVGSAVDCDVEVAAPEFEVEGRPATLFRDSDGVRIRDDGSGSVYLNGNRVEQAALRHGDLVRLGRMELRFLSGEAAETAYKEEIYRLGTEDHLTGLMNRRAFDESLEREVERARRYERPVSLLLVDIDDMQRLNAEYGHAAGDFVVRAVAEVIRNRARKVDLVARFAGTRFAVVLPEVPSVGARAVGETLRGLVEDQALMYAGNRVTVTVTVGFGTVQGEDSQPAALLDASEQALLQGKTSGRNCVVGPTAPDLGGAG